VTQESWLTPDGVIGAAAPVDSQGKDIDSTMKAKLVSYLTARMRAVSEGKGHRGEVISAMIDADSELKIGDKLIKPKGQLLSLTANEAMRMVGTPPEPLLGAGIATSVDDLLSKRLNGVPTIVTTLELTWSERLAVLLNRFAPILMGIGMFALFIEFKTPGFGIFGVTGVVLLGVVFFGGYVAGLSGHEPVVLFVLGVILVLLEMLFFHSAGFLGVAGVFAILGSLVWSTADLWPNEPLSVAWSSDAFAMPVARLGIAMAIAIGLVVALWNFIPKGWFWQHFIITSASKGTAQLAGLASGARLDELVGSEGVVATDLMPSGQILVNGRRMEARLDVGSAVSGEKVRIVRASDFAVVVERLEA
jgi:membrane-bound serine protease (ClpP class)